MICENKIVSIECQWTFCLVVKGVFFVWMVICCVPFEIFSYFLILALALSRNFSTGRTTNDYLRRVK